MTCKDSVSCIRTTQLCVRILPSLIKREALREFVGKELLSSALQVSYTSIQLSIIFLQIPFQKAD